MAEHTPGPWYAGLAVSGRGYSRRIAGPQGQFVASVGTHDLAGAGIAPQYRIENRDTIVANAHLIAAAPAMLLTLREIERELSEGRTTDLLERIAASGSDTAWVARLALKARAALTIATTA